MAVSQVRQTIQERDGIAAPRNADEIAAGRGESGKQFGIDGEFLRHGSEQAISLEWRQDFKERRF